MQHSSGSSGSGNKRVRTACEGCRRRKIRCDGGFPCERCVATRRLCEYDDLPVKRSATEPLDAQSLRTRALVSGSVCGAASSSPPSSPSTPLTPSRRQQLAPTLPRELSFDGTSFGSRELHFLNTFLRTFHVSCPSIPARMFRDGVNPINLELLSATDDRPKIEASRAVSWAAAAVGASSSDVSLAHTYAAAAVRHLRQCFEVPCEESVLAYIMVSAVSYQLGNVDAFFRYADFANALEETMPRMAPEAQYAVIWHRWKVQRVSNGDRFHDKPVIFPPLEEIERLDFRLQLLFLEYQNLQRVQHIMFDASIPKEEKIQTCREAIDVWTPLLEVLETNSQYKNCSLLRMHMYISLCYFWAVCGDKAKALQCAVRFLDLFEQNLFLMAVPNAIELRITSSFLGKLGAPELQQRVERLLAKGSKYVIWTPPHSEDIALLQHLEVLAEELQQTQEQNENAGSTRTTENESPQPILPQQLADFDFGEEASLLDDMPDGFDVLGEFLQFTESDDRPSG